jgi:hypothetical protein
MRNKLLEVAEVSTAARLWYAGDPCICGHADPPNLLLLYVGNPEFVYEKCAPGCTNSFAALAL